MVVSPQSPLHLHFSRKFRSGPGLWLAAGSTTWPSFEKNVDTWQSTLTPHYILALVFTTYPRIGKMVPQTNCSLYPRKFREISQEAGTKWLIVHTNSSIIFRSSIFVLGLESTKWLLVHNNFSLHPKTIPRYFPGGLRPPGGGGGGGSKS